MNAPVRIQLSRAKGWKMPPNTVSVARPTKWGNPYRVAPAFESEGIRISAIDAETAVALFRERYEMAFHQWASMREALQELRGKNLACWCKPGAPCHADVLLDLANRP